MESKIKVIYLVGEGRSGTTLLEKILAEQNEIFAGGELRYIWERSIKENQLCSCGKRFHECEVWKNIMSDLNFDVQTIINSYNKIGRMRFYPIRDLLRKLRKKDFDIVMNSFYKLYKNILVKTESSYIIDSSKHPMFAYILSMHPNIELYTIHLIRDARAVTYSTQKKRIRPEVKDKIEYMPTYPAYISALAWKFVNIASEDLEKTSLKYIRIRYEDMLQNIKETLKKLYLFLDLKKVNNNFIKENNVLLLHANHTVSGNPMRFKSGEIELKLDDEWKTKLSYKDKKIVEFICHNELKKYWY